MKTKTFFLLSTLVIFFILSIISSCKKDNNDNNNKESNKLTISFEDGYIFDYGWVVINSPDGNNVIDYKKAEGNTSLDFGLIGEESITVTILNVKTSLVNGQQRKYIYINSYLASPFGDWILKGGIINNQILGATNLTMSYPSGNYSEYTIGTSDYWQSSYEVPNDQINEEFDIYYLDAGNKFSIYGAVLTDNGGYCNWLIDQNFQLNTINNYELELNEPLNVKNVFTNRPLKNIYLMGFWNQRNSQLLLYNNVYWNVASEGEYFHDIIYPFNIPVSDLYFEGSYYDGNIEYSFCKFYSMSQGLPDQIDIPEIGISASYNETNDEITNIQIDGTADQIDGFWIYFFNNELSRNIIYWSVYADCDYSSLKRPVLPQEIINNIGENINKLEPYFIEIIDYNTTLSHNDIINRFFIDDIPYMQICDECFYSSYSFDQIKKSKIKPNDKRMHNIINLR